MKIVKNKMKIAIVVIATAFSISSCETTDLNRLSDPSELTPESADAQLLLNNVQLNFIEAQAFNEGNEDGLNVRVQETMRMQHLFGPYTGPFSLTQTNIYNNLWVNFYRETLFDIQTLIPIAEETGLTGHTGIAKIFKAYTYVILVDTWGDVPYTEALLGLDNQNPRPDEGQLIYNDMLSLLDEAIADIEAVDPTLMPETLFYEQTDQDKWLRLARTLKFKMYLQMRLIGDFSTEINALISEGLIENENEDFALQYLADAGPADARHPSFAVNYDADGPPNYMSNYYMAQFKDVKSVDDPRLRYYFYRQIDEAPTGANLPCDEDTIDNCYIGDFYWGRPHGLSTGVPNDSFSRTTYGLYPAGGAFDDDSFEDVDSGAGAQGAGIYPVMLSSFVKFMLAESALMSGTTGDPRTLLEEGIMASMNKVTNFQTSSINAARVLVEDDPDTADINEEVTVESLLATQESIDAYIAFVLEQYDNAADDNERLDIIIKEYYLALWGNGYEAWNNYRRTSFPSDLEDHVETPGQFPRTFFYPSGAVNTNTNLNQKELNVQVFWDVNPDNLD